MLERVRIALAGLRRVLTQLARRSRTREASRRALRALAGFAGALKVKYHDIEVGLDPDPEPGLADNGDLELDLLELMEAIGQARRSADTGLIMIVDELQPSAPYLTSTGSLRTTITGTSSSPVSRKAARPPGPNASGMRVASGA